ncbi:MAG TPA: rRNA maturation RNase YbeY [Ktedonobacteraceae bacterium]|nr:rRNA maturation RNase YbeY [Ktedonobacteraceae bacterium]
MGEEVPKVELNIEYSDDGIQHTVLQTLSSSTLELAVKQTLRQAGIVQPVTLSLLITDDETIHSLNKQYRQQDKPTDVLSFPLLDEPLVHAPTDQLWLPPEDEIPDEARANSPVFVTPPELATNLGDVVISWPTVLRQASGSNISPAYELLYLLSHGTLHLVGYDDQAEAGYQAMVHLQQSVLQAMGQKASPA